MSALSAANVPDDALAPHLKEAAKLMRRGVFVACLGIVPAMAWLAWAPLASAVVAEGTVKVDLNRRPVQHAEGGTVAEVLVRDGQRVRKGDPLLRLSDVSVDADKNRVTFRVRAERISLARLDSEQRLLPTVQLAPELEQAARTDPRLAELIERERTLFEARRSALVGQIGLLRTQRTKVEQEITALHAQVGEVGESLRHQQSELESSRKLEAEGYISAAKVRQVEASLADYRARIEERRSELARAEQRLVDTDIRIRTLESEYRQQATDQQKIVAARLSEVEQELRKADDASTRQVVLAPASGVIIDLRYQSPGAVVPPRETVADIVPDDTKLVIEGRIQPQDINRVQLGQAAEVRLTAFKYRTTKLVTGKVVHVSADRLTDRSTGVQYYVVMIEVGPESLKAAGDLTLQAGMPAEIYVAGAARTAMEYLIEPITDVVRKAARER